MVLVSVSGDIIITLVKTALAEIDRINSDVFIILSDEEETLGDELAKQLKDGINNATTGFLDARSHLEFKEV